MRHKLSLSIEYVSDWTVQDALRELFQNAVDHGSWTYKFFKDSLEIRSHDIHLDNAMLLLGHSRKAEGSVGKFGEGFKLAVLVLTRLGYKITIDTADEIWRPKLIKSRTYKTQQLVFDTEKSKVALKDLIFTVESLTLEDIEGLKKNNLHVQPTGIELECDYGYVIDRPGDIFVNGLFVSHMEGYRFGYNFKPQHLTLDRDRRLVRDFDLQYLTSQIWSGCDDNELVLEMIEAELPDVKYLQYFLTDTLADAAAKAFLVEHGTDAVPVVTQSDIAQAKEEGHDKIVLVPAAQKELIYKSHAWTAPLPKVVKQTPRELLLEYKLNHWGDEAEFEILLEKAEGWS